MSWTKERKSFVTFIVLLFCVVVAISLVLPVILKEPTCTDGKRNGTEAGIDCGGLCGQVCTNTIIPLEIEFQRSVEVDERTYDAVAYLVNKNNEAIPTYVSFKAILSDKNGSTIAEKEGRSIVLPGAATPLYIPNIVVEDRVPVRTRFELIETGPFYKYSNKDFLKNVQVVDQVFDNTTNTPRLTLTIANTLFSTVKDIDVYALLYDEEGTLVAVGKTYIEAIAGQGKEKAYFSWRTPFSSPKNLEFILVRDPFAR